MSTEALALTADIIAGQPRVVHGFFTRLGGVSDGVYASLNCGMGSGDDKARVAENRRRLMAALDLPAEALATAYQVHSATVAEVERLWPRGHAPRVDGLVTARRGVALGVSTADCAPVLLADAGAGVVGAAHAGWRGAIGGVLQATVAAMIDMGAARECIVAAVGPCIAQASYEVGPEFPAPFLAEDAANDRFFSAADENGRRRFDLGGYAAHVLAGLGLAEVAVLGVDTYAESERFFSYRRTTHRGEPDYGRNLSVIALSDKE